MKNRFPTVLRWAARIAALGLLILLGTFFTAEIVSPHSGPPRLFREWMGLVLICAIPIAAVAAWKHQLIGGFISLCAWLLFWAMTGLGQVVVMLALALPGVLMVCSGFTDRRMTHQH